MEVLLFRHGPAEAAGAAGPSDADRALTDLGRERTLRAAQGLARVVDRPGALLSSPKKRAYQTACLLGEVFDLSVEAHESLAREEVGPLERLLRERTEGAVVLIGHEPTLGRLAASLLGVAPGAGEVEVKKAGAVLVEAALHPYDAPGPARLRMALPPRVLRRLADGAG